jgi:uncharacterized protein with GYD domain
MPKFVMLSTLGPDGYSRLREDPQRLRAVNADVEAMGVKVLAQYALLGQYDFLNILEAPDELTMAKVATTLSARGTMRSVTLTAIDVDAYVDVMGAGVDQG